MQTVKLIDAYTLTTVHYLFHCNDWNSCVEWLCFLYDIWPVVLFNVFLFHKKTVEDLQYVYFRWILLNALPNMIFIFIWQCMGKIIWRFKMLNPLKTDKLNTELSFCCDCTITLILMPLKTCKKTTCKGPWRLFVLRQSPKSLYVCSSNSSKRSIFVLSFCQRKCS